MDESLHNIDDLFFNELEGYKEMPSARTWDEISSELDKPSAPQVPPAPVRSFRFLKVALVFVMMVTGYALNKVVVSQKPVVVSQKQLASGKEQETGNREKVTDNREEVIVSSKQMAGDRGQVIGNREEVTGNREEVKVSSKQMATGSQQVKSYLQPFSSNQQPAINNASTASATKTHQKPAARSQQPLKAVDSPDNKNGLTFSTNVATKPTQNSTPKTQHQVVLSTIPLFQDSLSISRNIATKIPQQPVASSQKPIIKLSTKKQLSVSTFFAPSFTWSKMEDHEEHRPGGWGGRPHEDHNDIRENEKAGFSYTAGVGLRLGLGKHWSVESGLSFSSSNTKQEPKKLYADHDDNGEVRYRLNCSAGYTYVLPESNAAPAVGDSILMNSSGYAVQYLNIPVLAGYTFGKGRFRAGLIAGPQFNVLLKGRSSAVLQQNTNSKTTVASSIQGLKKLTTDMVAGISADYLIAPRFSLNLSPQGRISLSSINQGGTVISKTGAFNLSAGLRYYF